MSNHIFLPADILLPKSGFDRWSVIACDQYTSDASYWEKVSRIVGEAPSAYHITFPEIYLSEENHSRIQTINANMNTYLDSGVFELLPNSFVYVERQTSFGLRRGIVGKIDLEAYGFEKESNAPVRATEATVIERVPPRVAIRKDAPIEIPHVMLFIDDKNRTVIEPLQERKSDFKKLYDFDLMMNGGHIKGYCPDELATNGFLAALDTLAQNNDGFLFAVGDGNHSLAAAKESYLQNKTEQNRYALVEIVNLHEPSIVFEPIYRVLFGVDAKALLCEFKDFCGAGEEQTFTALYGDKEEPFSVRAAHPLAVGTLQLFLDQYLSGHSEVKIDYIHGENEVRKLAQNDNTLGFLFDGMSKEDLFPAVKHSGSLPRKTFSMGQADDKRFYLEARKLS